jgi:trigger factor
MASAPRAPVEPLSVEKEQLPGSRVGLNIEVPQATVDATYERVLNRLVNRARIEGFRPGKAPRPLVEARLGASAIREEVIEALVPGVVGQALNESNIEAIDRPSVEVVELERGRPARLTARVSVMPSITLPDVSTLHVERRHTEVDDAMVQNRLTGMLESQAEIEPVDREVRQGDIVVADLAVEVDGTMVESERRTAAEITVAEDHLRPELLAVLPGAKVGETVVAETVLPEDHRNPDLRDKPARLHLTVQGVKEKRLPELTDDVAAAVSEGRQTTAQALREATHTDLETQARQLDQLALEQAVLREVVGAAQVEVPESLIEREVDHELQTLERNLQRQGLRLELYFQYLGQTLEQWQAGARPEAEGRIRTELVLDELVRSRGTEVSEAEVEAALREEADHDAEIQEKLTELLASPAARDFFKRRLQRRRLLEWLMETLAPAPSPEPAPVQAAAAAAAEIKEETQR